MADGRLTLIIEGRERQLGKGEFFVFPSDCRYAYRNDGQEPVRFVRNVVI